MARRATGSRPAALLYAKSLEEAAKKELQGDGLEGDGEQDGGAAACKVSTGGSYEGAAGRRLGWRQEAGRQRFCMQSLYRRQLRRSSWATARVATGSRTGALLHAESLKEAAKKEL